MAPNLQPGDRVLIELKNRELYEGTIIYISCKSVEIYNIFNNTSNTSYPGAMTFYRNEVTSITPVKESAPQNPTIPNGESDNSLKVSKKITMCPEEFQRLKQMTLNHVFIDRFGKQFDDAVAVLCERESVGVVGLGNTFNRGKGLSLLVVSDFKQVYIFDMQCLVELKDLREVLEADYICKVVHGGAALYDCLYHRYKLEMKNVFDVKVVDSMSTEDNTTRDIGQCLTHHFNFPQSLLSAAVEDMGDRTWQERPVLLPNKIKAAQLAVYLLAVRDKLMGQIMGKYTRAIDKEYKKYKTVTNGDLIKFRMSI